MIPNQRRLLRDAIVSVCPTDDALVMYVDLYLGKNLDAFVPPGGLEVRAYKLIKEAESRGWLHNLVRTLLASYPENELVFAFAKVYRLRTYSEAELAVPAGTQLFDDAYFDLSSAKDLITGVMFSRQRGLLGLSITTEEESVAKRLCAWLPHCLGELQLKDDVSLGAVMTDPGHKVKQVLQHLPELEETGVVCRVLVKDATAAAVEEFWQGVQSECDTVGNWFVLVFVTVSDDRRATGVLDLGCPAFRVADVNRWTTDVAAMLDWPRDVAVPWSEWMQRKAKLSEDQLDLHLTYGAFNRSTQGVRQHRNDPNGFLAWLREKA
ncbi:effector-associated domain EAD1-containing protein [Actinoplanes derwentensis]|uniref:Effector-associated domain-containing protein n=1 Tax=Actinoplanes derwentensis TaxID=113562 RepID=A0A1H1XW99_9ACTN|nr:effector-associated domain EAD1-containing protein [Actinoplanes derwentensis]GID90289.1 hypothetical protein Ade03nite_92130 [Actinoplanes derwentensis]SDT13484.1 hypothetical protein SAMN04489716_2613 [Actinoplanes derwentensis]